ncbi:MAG TPA: helix-turn-helix domain-containing protein [Solirubrobacterales bacterium]|nr:helix-turn-helix domain-containing protein [Solirubrobacterales bacterium]
MNRTSARRIQSIQEIRADLVARLRARLDEIEDAIFLRVQALSPEKETEDPEYRAGIRASVAEGVNYALISIEQGEDWAEPVPSLIAVQARRSARSGVGLDTVLRRYAAADRLLAEFITEEASGIPTAALRQVLRVQGPQVDRVMAAVAAEYMSELELMRRSPAQRMAERVQRLLAGDSPVDAADLGYELEGWHLGLVVTGSRADVAARTLAAGLSRPVLVVLRGDESAWAWLGGQEELPVADVARYLSAGVLGNVSLAVGEPRRGLEGWRLTHQEAQAARLVMLRRPQPLTRASDIVLLAAVLRDEALAKSLRETYLVPLDRHGDADLVLRQTLRAYFAAGFNAATAAAALEVDRHTVQRRLRKVEEALGRLLHSCHAELAVALSLEELDPTTVPGASADAR